MGRRDMRDAIDTGRKDRGRVYFAYDQLEEYHAGMWRPVHTDREQVRLMGLAVTLLRCTRSLDVAMRRVVAEWPRSCESEFTRAGNHAAWLGQAACCLVCGVPEGLTRRAWWKLTGVEQASANAVAAAVESAWVGRVAQLALWGAS